MGKKGRFWVSAMMVPTWLSLSGLPIPTPEVNRSPANPDVASKVGSTTSPSVEMLMSLQGSAFQLK